MVTDIRMIHHQKVIDTTINSTKAITDTTANITETDKNYSQPQVTETGSCLPVPPTKKIKIENKVITGDPYRALNYKSSKKKVSPTNKRKQSSVSTSSLKGSQGRWTPEEHQAFLEGLKECGRK